MLRAMREPAAAAIRFLLCHFFPLLFSFSFHLFEMHGTIAAHFMFHPPPPYAIFCRPQSPSILPAASMILLATFCRTSQCSMAPCHYERFSSGYLPIQTLFPVTMLPAHAAARLAAA